MVAFEGQVLCIRPGESACYRCVFPTAPPPEARRGCREAGVLGAMAGVVGSLQALEALKLLSGVGTPLTDRLLRIDGLTGEQTLVATSARRRRPAQSVIRVTCSDWEPWPGSRARCAPT